MKFLALFLIMLPLLATAEERASECRREISVAEFAADRNSGCFLEIYEPDSLMYIMEPLNVGDKAMTVNMGRKLPTAAEDFMTNTPIRFYSSNGENAGRGDHWPYADFRRVNRNKVSFGNPFNATVEISPLPAGQKRVTITRRSGPKAVFLCKPFPDDNCDNPAIVESNMPKEIRDFVPPQRAAGSETLPQ